MPSDPERAHDRDPEERDDAARTTSRRFTRWVWGVLVAAIAAILTSAVTGVLSSAGSGLRGLVTGEDDPVGVVVTSDFVRSSRFPARASSWIITRPIGALQYPREAVEAQDVVELDRWAEGYDAIDANFTDVEVVVTGRSAEPVILDGIRIKVVKRGPPPTGVQVGPLGAGAVAVRSFLVDLDRTPPSVAYFTGDEPAPGERPVEFPYRVSATEPEVFVIISQTERHDVTWVAELSWISGEQRGVTVIDNDGTPFRTAASANATPYDFSGGRFVRRG